MSVLGVDVTSCSNDGKIQQLTFRFHDFSLIIHGCCFFLFGVLVLVCFRKS